MTSLGIHLTAASEKVDGVFTICSVLFSRKYTVNKDPIIYYTNTLQFITYLKRVTMRCKP